MIDFHRAHRSIPALVLLVFTACGGDGTGATSTSGAGGAASTSTSTASTTGAGGAMASTTTGTGEPMCELALYPDRPACQTRMDASCCAEEQACAADPDCQAFVDCLYECPDPKDQLCTNTCGSKATKEAQAELTAIGHCSGMHPQLPDQSCAFP
jgi:hypothetical protein